MLASDPGFFRGLREKVLPIQRTYPVIRIWHAGCSSGGNVVFAQHNLVTDGSFNDFQLVLCRNVAMYFTAPLKERAHGLIHDSLVRFGFLGLGRRETVTRARETHYALADRREKIYRKVA